MKLASILIITSIIAMYVKRMCLKAQSIVNNVIVVFKVLIIIVHG